MHSFNRNRCFIVVCALRLILGSFEEQKENINIVFNPPLHVLAWNSATPTRRIFMTFNIFNFFYKIFFREIKKNLIAHANSSDLFSFLGLYKSTNIHKCLYCCTVHLVDSLIITQPTNALIVCHLFLNNFLKYFHCSYMFR